MQATDTGSHNAQRKIVSPNQHRRTAYSKVMDKRKCPIRGLWERNGRYYAQLTVEDQITGIKQVKRVPMEGVSNCLKWQRNDRSLGKAKYVCKCLGGKSIRAEQIQLCEYGDAVCIGYGVTASATTAKIFILRWACFCYLQFA